MLAGCLAITGAGSPVLDRLVGLLLEGRDHRPGPGVQQSESAVRLALLRGRGGPAITAFYMFRLWFMTFLGEPRDHHVYEHAHESPPVMYVPLVVLATFAVIAGWSM